MTKLEQFLAEVRERESKATKPPWVRRKYFPGISALEPDANGSEIVCSILVGNANFPERAKADEDFAMRARTDIPRLLTIVERQAKALDKLENNRSIVYPRCGADQDAIDEVRSCRADCERIAAGEEAGR